LDQKSRELRIWLKFSLAGLSIVALFGFIVYELARHAGDTGNTPKLGQMAPAFTLPDDHGKPVSLLDLMDTPATGSSGARSPKVVLIVFYRGYW